MPLTDVKQMYVDGCRYVLVCRSVDVVERRGYRVEIDIEHDLALFRVDGQVRCVTNVCPHKREARIFDGFVADGTVSCPLHAWRFDLCTGKNVVGQAGLRTYDAIERGGQVWVSVPE